MIEAGSRVNWSALESGVADKIYFYYAPKILGGNAGIRAHLLRGRLQKTVVVDVPNDQFRELRVGRG